MNGENECGNCVIMPPQIIAILCLNVANLFTHTHTHILLLEIVIKLKYSYEIVYADTKHSIKSLDLSFSSVSLLV